MKLSFERALILAPHTDDGELGCGATISNLLRNGTEVYYVAFSSCKESLPAGYAEDSLVKEMKSATLKLGIKPQNTRVFDFSVRRFEEQRQEILDAMLQIGSEINPDVVFSPSVHDVHQDHVTIANECLRAFKKKTILQYEVPWNNYTFDNQFFYCVDEMDVNAKIEAVACYESQSGKDYAKEEFIKGLLLTHGVQIGKKYAEVFEIPHFIVGK